MSEVRLGLTQAFRAIVSGEIETEDARVLVAPSFRWEIEDDGDGLVIIRLTSEMMIEVEE